MCTLNYLFHPLLRALEYQHPKNVVMFKTSNVLTEYWNSRPLAKFYPFRNNVHIKLFISPTSYSIRTIRIREWTLLPPANFKLGVSWLVSHSQSCVIHTRTITSTVTPSHPLVMCASIVDEMSGGSSIGPRPTTRNHY